MKHLFSAVILLSLLCYIGFGVYLFLKQRSFIYFPVQYGSGSYEELTFENQSESIAATVINKAKSDAIIYFGGNAENVDFNVPDFQRTFSEHAVYLVKYRGYGSSTGKPTEAGIYSDALHIFDQISKKHTSVSVIGRSLGGGVATYLAVQRSIDKLILVTPFDSVKSVAQKLFPIYPLGWLLKDHYNSLERVASIDVKTLIIIAENDQVIAREHSNRLVSGFKPELVQYNIISDRGHNDLSDTDRYFLMLKNFLGQ